MYLFDPNFNYFHNSHAFEILKKPMFSLLNKSIYEGK